MTTRASRRCPTCSLYHAPHCATGRQWPTTPLLAAADRLHSTLTWRDTEDAVRTALGVSRDTLRLWRKVPAMLTDEQADRYAVALGLHPSQVWPGWDEAGLSVLDAVFLRSGWRQAWEFEGAEDEAVAS